MAAIVRLIGGRISSWIIRFLAASQVFDILSGGSPAEDSIKAVSQAVGRSVTKEEVIEAVKGLRGRYFIVDSATDTIVMPLSRQRVYRLLTTRRRRHISRKTVLVLPEGKRDIKLNGEVIR